MSAKFIFGIPPHICRFCKKRDAKYTIGEEWLYTPYRLGGVEGDSYDIQANKELIERILVDYGIQANTYAATMNKGCRFSVWRLDEARTPTVSRLEWQSIPFGVRRFIKSCFGQKGFRTKPSFSKVEKLWVKHLEKEALRSVPKVKVRYSKNLFICSEECFNLWLLNKSK
jgi:hypothetical protein